MPQRQRSLAGSAAPPTPLAGAAAGAAQSPPPHSSHLAAAANQPRRSKHTQSRLAAASRRRKQQGELGLRASKAGSRRGATWSNEGRGKQGGAWKEHGCTRGKMCRVRVRVCACVSVRACVRMRACTSAHEGEPIRGHATAKGQARGGCSAQPSQGALTSCGMYAPCRSGSAR